MKALRTMLFATMLLLVVSAVHAQTAPEARMPGKTFAYVRVMKPARLFVLADPPGTPAGGMGKMRKEFLAERAEGLGTTAEELAAEIAGLGRVDVAFFGRGEGQDPGMLGIVDLGKSRVIRARAEKETGFPNKPVEVIDGTPVHTNTVAVDGKVVPGTTHGFNLGDAFVATNGLDVARAVLKPDAKDNLAATEGFRRASAGFGKDALLTVYCSIPNLLAARRDIEDWGPFFLTDVAGLFLKELDTVTLELSDAEAGPVLSVDALMAKEPPSYDAVVTPAGNHDLLKLVGPDVRWCVSFHIDDAKARWARFEALMNKLTEGEFGRQDVAMIEQQLQIKVPDEIGNITAVVIGQMPGDDEWGGSFFVMLRAKDVGRLGQLMKKVAATFGEENPFEEKVIDEVTVFQVRGEQGEPNDEGGYVIFDDVFLLAQRMDTIRSALNARKTKKDSVLDVPINAKMRALLPEKPSKIVIFDPVVAEDEVIDLLDAPRQRCFVATVEEPGRLRVQAAVAPLIRLMARSTMQYGFPFGRSVKID